MLGKGPSKKYTQCCKTNSHFYRPNRQMSFHDYDAIFYNFILMFTLKWSCKCSLNSLQTMGNCIYLYDVTWASSISFRQFYKLAIDIIKFYQTQMFEINSKRWCVCKRAYVISLMSWSLCHFVSLLSSTLFKQTLSSSWEPLILKRSKILSKYEI